MIEKFKLADVEVDENLGIVEMKSEFIPDDNECLELDFVDRFVIHIDEIHCMCNIKTGAISFFAFDNTGRSQEYCGTYMAEINWILPDNEKEILKRTIGNVYA